MVAPGSCWECARRRRVCDKARPHCLKCHAFGIQCPGYGSTRPLVFMPCGMRNRKKKTKKKSTQPHEDDIAENAVTVKKPPPVAAVPAILRNQHHEFIDAIEFLNAYRAKLFVDTIFEDHPYFAAIPPAALSFPPSILHSVSAIALHLRLTSFGSTNESVETKLLMVQCLQQKRNAIRGLNKEIAAEGSESSPLTVTSINCLQHAELLCAKSPEWRPHARALTLIHDKQDRATQSKELDVTAQFGLIKWLYTTVVANTTSPAHDQIFAVTHLKHLQRVESFCHSGATPFAPFPVPQPLLSCVVRINILRAQSCESPLRGINESFKALLQQVESFDPVSWASTHEDGKNSAIWSGIARLFQLAVQIFAGGSLAPFSSDARIYRKSHVDTLAHEIFNSFRDMSADPAIWLAALWPLIVAGFAADERSAEDKSCVREKLRLIFRAYGYFASMNALETLQEFWDRKDRKEWDECFDQPRAFIM